MSGRRSWAGGYSDAATHTKWCILTFIHWKCMRNTHRARYLANRATESYLPFGLPSLSLGFALSQCVEIYEVVRVIDG